MADERYAGQVDEWVELYASGQTYQQIADRFGVAAMTVWAYIRRAGGGRSRADAARLAFLREMESITAPLLADYDAGMSVLALHRRYGIQRSAVASLVKANGRTLRTRHEAAVQRFASRDQRGRVAIRAHFSMGKGESEFCELLAERGVTFERQKVVADRNIDIAIGNVAVEVHALQFNPFAPCWREVERCKDLMREGWHVIYIWLGSTDLEGRAADEVIAFSQEVSGLPAGPRQYRVIRGDGELTATGSGDPPEMSFKRTPHRRRNPRVG